MKLKNESTWLDKLAEETIETALKKKSDKLKELLKWDPALGQIRLDFSAMNFFDEVAMDEKFENSYVKKLDKKDQQAFMKELENLYYKLDGMIKDNNTKVRELFRTEMHKLKSTM